MLGESLFFVLQNCVSNSSVEKINALRKERCKIGLNFANSPLFLRIKQLLIDAFRKPFCGNFEVAQGSG
ncbi:MAG: hypothetical protein AAFY63_22945, partial [Cyanobacteria bacterium J06643_13]